MLEVSVVKSELSNDKYKFPQSVSPNQTYPPEYEVNPNSYMCLPGIRKPFSKLMLLRLNRNKPHVQTPIIPTHQFPSKVSKDIILRSTVPSFVLSFILKSSISFTTGFLNKASDSSKISLPYRIAYHCTVWQALFNCFKPSSPTLPCLHFYIHPCQALCRLLGWLCIFSYFLINWLSLTVFHVYVNQINIYD